MVEAVFQLPAVWINIKKGSHLLRQLRARRSPEISFWNAARLWATAQQEHFTVVPSSDQYRSFVLSWFIAVTSWVNLGRNLRGFLLADSGNRENPGTVSLKDLIMILLQLTTGSGDMRGFNWLLSRYWFDEVVSIRIEQSASLSQSKQFSDHLPKLLSPFAWIFHWVPEGC
jgi:hypothetical protein